MLGLILNKFMHSKSVLTKCRLQINYVSCPFSTYGNPFHFYSFEEEIHKLKVAKETARNKPVDKESQENINFAIKEKLELLNQLFQEGKMFNFSIDPLYVSAFLTKKELKNKEQKSHPSIQKVNDNEDSQIQENQQLDKVQKDIFFISTPIKIVQEILASEITRAEKALVLENFLHNTLLSLLCDSSQLYKKVLSKQEKGPLLDEIKLLKDFIENITSSSNLFEIAKESISIFKFLVKSFETLRVKQPIAFPFIQKYLNEVIIKDTRISSLHEFSLILLPISDYFHEININNSNNSRNNEKIDISELCTKIRSLLKENDNLKKGGKVDVNTLCKTLFCLVRINNGKGKVCLDLADALLSSSYETLTEIEMTSILYSLSKLQYNREEEILFERKIKREMPNLIFDYETKIEKMLSTRYFHYERIPYILYCLQNSTKYRPAYRRNQVNYLCRSLFYIAIKNHQKYKASEITTIIYSLKLLNPSFQPEIEQLYRTYFLKVALDKRNEENQKDETRSQQQKQAEQLADEIIDDLTGNKSQVTLNHMDRQLQKGKEEINSLNQFSQIAKEVSPLIAPVQDDSRKNVRPQLNSQSKMKQQPFKNSGFNIKMQKVRNTIVYFEQLQAVDILCLFIGIRNNERSSHQQNSMPSRDEWVDQNSDSILVINQQLFQLFLSKQSGFTNNLKIKILYEVAYNHSQLVDSFIFEKYFSEWIQKIQDQMETLNNHDFIALGFIMKKFARLFSYHIDFWIKFNDETSRRQFVHQVEASRIRLIIQNMNDFYFKCINSPQSLKQQEKTRTKKLQVVLDKLCETQSRLHQNQINSSQNSEMDAEFDFDSFGM